MENRNNAVTISGLVCEKPAYSHSMYKEDFYIVNLEVPRMSGAIDVIPVIVSSQLIDIDFLVTYGTELNVKGEYRSYNKRETGKGQLILNVFAKEIEIGASDLSNEVELVGYICKPPVYRETPMGREITDILLAVNRPYDKSDYIPCIVWGRSAKFAKRLNVGDCVKVIGRIQSREYVKKISETECETRTAYEVSVRFIAKGDVLSDNDTSEHSKGTD